MEKALTLKEAAALLGVSYGTVYAHKEQLGFFQVGSVWRVWPDMLRERSLADREENPHPRTKTAKLPVAPRTANFTAILEEDAKAVRDFEDLLANRLKGRPGRKKK